MCGIVGIFSFQGKAPWPDVWPDLVNHLQHRGPDEGAWWGQGPFFLGHRRLSIIDVEGGAQPMATPEADLVVTFNGEIYNHLELRRELHRKGCEFLSQSDTEVLLHGYRVWGPDLVRRLTGMFAFAIADRRRNELFLARDRFGEKPLYYRIGPTYVAFASELRPLAALPGLTRTLDAEALGGYLCLNYVPGDATLLQEVRKLAPASWMRFQLDGNSRTERFWEPPHDEAPAAAAPLGQEVLRQCRSRLDDAVKLCLRSDVPVGVLLSGGMDSSLVAESAVRQGTLCRAYFLDFEDRRYSEYEAASAVADRLGLDLERVVLTPCTFEGFMELVEHADDPLADASVLPMWAISRLAAQNTKVVLSGDGGDEIFGGYLTYKASRIHARTVSRLPGPLRHLLARIAAFMPTTEGKVTTSYKAKRFLRAADLPTRLAHFTWNGAWLPGAAARLLEPGPAQVAAENALSQLVERLGLSGDRLQDLQIADMHEYLPNDILTKVDRMSMAHGLEVRAPMLNHDLAEWVLRGPEGWRMSRGRLKVLLRELARGVFGDNIADRPKAGFSIPIHTWIRGPLRETVCDLLAPESVASTGFLNPEEVSRVLDIHLKRHASYGFELWGLAVLVAWHRIRIAHCPASPPKSPLIERVFGACDERTG